MEGMHVLLVEDNELNMEIARYLLEEAGVQVIAAKNGQEALDIFEQSREQEIDLILMDIMMQLYRLLQFQQMHLLTIFRKQKMPV